VHAFMSHDVCILFVLLDALAPASFGSITEIPFVSGLQNRYSSHRLFSIPTGDYGRLELNAGFPFPRGSASRDTAARARWNLGE
jgi:hypothetical protein